MDTKQQCIEDYCNRSIYLSNRCKLHHDIEWCRVGHPIRRFESWPKPTAPKVPRVGLYVRMPNDWAIGDGDDATTLNLVHRRRPDIWPADQQPTLPVQPMKRPVAPGRSGLSRTFRIEEDRTTTSSFFRAPRQDRRTSGDHEFNQRRTPTSDSTGFLMLRQFEFVATKARPLTRLVVVPLETVRKELQWQTKFLDRVAALDPDGRPSENPDYWRDQWQRYLAGVHYLEFEPIERTNSQNLVKLSNTSRPAKTGGSRRKNRRAEIKLGQVDKKSLSLLRDFDVQYAHSSWRDRLDAFSSFINPREVAPMTSDSIELTFKGSPENVVRAIRSFSIVPTVEVDNTTGDLAEIIPISTRPLRQGA